MLNDQIERYVALHRSFGRKFAAQERTLRLFAAYAGSFGDRHTNIERIYDWCRTASSQNVARTRFDVVRRFCLYGHAEDQKHQVPPASVFGRGKRQRPTPNIIEPAQLRAIMQAALDLPPKGKISPYTYYYVFGLLAATGLRISEALALQRDDVVDDGLIIRNGKFGKQRLLPIRPSTRRALETYLAIRKKLGAVGDDLFVTFRGRAPHQVSVRIVFVRLARKLGFRGPTGTSGTRLHDLRHNSGRRIIPPTAEQRLYFRENRALVSA
jgi:integrase